MFELNCGAEELGQKRLGAEQGDRVGDTKCTVTYVLGPQCSYGNPLPYPRPWRGKHTL